MTKFLNRALFVTLAVCVTLTSAQSQATNPGSSNGSTEWCVGYTENYRSKSATTVKESDACATRCGAKGSPRRTEVQGGCACEVPCGAGKVGGCAYHITRGNCSTPRTYEQPLPPSSPPGCPPPKNAASVRPDGCPDIPGMQKTFDNTCKCPNNQVTMIDECGNPVCKPWLLPPTRGTPTIYGPDKCPWSDRSHIPACKRYCDECLAGDYGWSVISELLFITQAKTELLAILTGKPGLGKNGEILSCLRSFLGAVGQTFDGAASSNSGGMTNYAQENGASNLAALACTAKDCMSRITGRDPFSTIPGGAIWSKALDVVCTAGDHLAKKIQCGTAHLECESVAHGAQPIPQCKGLSSHPILSTQKRIDPTTACLDCCSAQVLHVFEKCQKNKKDPSCQYYMNMCLGTC